MTDTDKVDARGLSCPQPALMTKQALLATSDNQLVVMVDSMTQVQNCIRTAEQLGWTGSFQESSGEFELTLKK